MAREWRPWWNTALDMLAEARAGRDREGLLGATFFAHQAAESALKAVWITTGDGNPPHIHNLVELAEGLNAPNEIVESCRELNPLYMTSRYPDAANGEPRRQLSAGIAARAVLASEHIVAWCGDHLPQRDEAAETTDDD
jgi:HEPN domain-containing protein